LSDTEINAIFLDTNIYESAKFKYTDNKLKKLFDLCKNSIKNELLKVTDTEF